MKTITKIEVAVTTLVLIMIIGTISYHNLEGWSYVDSFYFTGVTVTTVGYGDLNPSSDVSKIFTVLFAFAGIGITFFTITLLATNYIETRERKLGELLERQFIKDLEKKFDPRLIKKNRLRVRKEILKGAKF